MVLRLVEAPRIEGKDRAALWLKAKWLPGSVITVSFLEGDGPLQARVEAAAKQWIAPRRANLKFGFRTDTNDTNIRISFSRPGSWSVVGTTCKSITE